MNPLFAFADPAAADALQGVASGAVSSVPLQGALWLLAVPAVLAAAALLLKRKPAAERLLRIVETTSLGGKRALILATLGGESLLLASSEAGITLLTTRAVAAPAANASAPRAPPPAAAATAAPRLAIAPSPAQTSSPGLARALLAKIVPQRTQAPRPAPFQSLLEETAEDQDLRRKLVAGRKGRIS